MNKPSDGWEAAFDMGERVGVYDLTTDAWLADGVIDGLYPQEDRYDVRADDGRRWTAVHETELDEVGGST